ncbi:hypothetical protein K3495_g1894 [Podosphaera aphanis]|nr:hypothetical protein K3495_g1894 [Podosphaera aphanis]
MSIVASAQKPSSGLAGIPNGSDQRDSAYYSSKDPCSKHNSTQSTIGRNSMDRFSQIDTVSTANLTPSPIPPRPQSLSLSSPTCDAMSVASIVSPTSYRTRPPIYEPNPQISRNSVSSVLSVQLKNDYPRRESVDSRLGANFRDMRLANSPYASANQSTTSLQSNLAQQRNPGSIHQDRMPGPFRLSNGYHPNYQRLPDPPMITSRTAPLITGPTLGAIARASEPTKGQAWAFPEEPVQRIPPSIRLSDEYHNRPLTTYLDESRRNSFADSIASSQYTTESRLPPGQRRLEDGIPSECSHRGSTECQVSTHHHSLQQRNLAEIQVEGDSPNNSQPYSRTPELRVSHKLAERKRRLEMKDLFDNLRTLQCVERGAKASKWEILSKAISEHERQTKLIEEQKKTMNRLESQLQMMKTDLENAQRESNDFRTENAQLRTEIASLQSSSHRQYNGASSHPRTYGMQASEHQSQLPPIRSIQCPEIMNGVQYHHEQRSGAYCTTSERY